MKKILYSIAVLLTVCTGFSSCIDNFDEDERYTYPKQAPAYSAWAYEDQTGEDFSYSLNITENAAGDSVLTVTMLGLPDGPVVSTGVITEYDAASGTLVAEGSSELGYYLVSSLLPAKIYASYNGAGNKLSVSVSLIFNGGDYDAQSYIGAGSFTAVRKNHPITIDGLWFAADGSVTMQLLGYDESMETSIGQIQTDENETEYCVYDYDAATGVATIRTLTTEKTYTASYNEKGQFIFDNGGKSVLLELYTN